MNIFSGYLLTYSYIFGIFILALIIKVITKIKQNEIFRKFIHIFISFTWIFLYRNLVDTWHFVIIPSTIIILLVFILRYRLIPIIERSDSDSKDLGTLHYAISVTLICLLAKLFPASLIPGAIGIFALSFGDGTASIFGPLFKKFNLHITKTKTLAGSIACFVFSIIGVIILNQLVPFQIKLYQLLIIGIIATAMEIIGGNFDNYTLPFGVTAAAILMRIGEV